MRKSTWSGLGLASAAAVLFAVAPLSANAADAAKVKCEGANGCKGQSACKTAKNECKGQNGCKGLGFVELSKAECDAALAKMRTEKK